MQPRIGRLNFNARPGYFAAVAALATFEKGPHETQAAGGTPEPACSRTAPSTSCTSAP